MKKIGFLLSSILFVISTAYLMVAHKMGYNFVFIWQGECMKAINSLSLFWLYAFIMVFYIAEENK